VIMRNLRTDLFLLLLDVSSDFEFSLVNVRVARQGWLKLRHLSCCIRPLPVRHFI